jgi:hypothetical protein
MRAADVDLVLRALVATQRDVARLMEAEEIRDEDVDR